MVKLNKMEIDKAYKNCSIDVLIKKLNSSKKGLSESEVKSRIKKFGLNEIEKSKKIHPIFKFLSFLIDPLSIILIIAALISGLTGSFKNFIVIIIMVFAGGILKFYQEFKSGKAAEAIAKRLAIRSTVLRNNKKQEILSKEIVIGDIVFLSAGDIVPADGKIISCDDFFINESSLTGESFPIEKTIDGEDKDSIIYSASNVISGYATYLVLGTGKNTEYGKIAEKINKDEPPTSFEIGIKKFSFLILKLIVGLVIIIFFINTIQHKNILDSFVFAIAVAVGVTPELLSMIMSVNMAKGSIAMSKKGVIVKKLNAIPDFGSMDILCTDKTGTLTQDKVSLVKNLDINGNESLKVFELAYINGNLETGIKNLLDRAILEFGEKKKIKSLSEIKKIKKIDEIPYDFFRKRSSIVYIEKNNKLMVTKGAPEEIFKICSQYLENGKEVKINKKILDKAKELYNNLGAQGFRVLAIASKDVDNNKTKYLIQEEDGMTLIGFIAFFDPPKTSAKKTLVFMRNHGIEIKILTGDSHLVTKRVCEELDIPIKGIITGDELDINNISEEELGRKALGITIFGRMSPSQKEKIIMALKKTGAVVGYMGDGINDAPALKSADVGISVENGTDIAKESSDIILMKKGLKELMDGVIEGRKTFGNTMKYVMMGLSSNFGNMFSMIAAAIYLPFFPMLPSQILINNFIYDMSQISIPSDNVDEEYLNKPKRWDMKFIRKFTFIFGPISSLFDILTFILLYNVFHFSGSQFQTGWFIESLLTQVLVIFIIRTNQNPLKSRPSKYILLTSLLALFIGFTLISPLFAKYIGFSLLPINVLLSIFALVFIYLIVVETVKKIFYKKIYINV